MTAEVIVEFHTALGETLSTARTLAAVPRKGDHILRSLEEDAYVVEDVVWWLCASTPTVIAKQVEGRRYSEAF